MFKLGCAEKMLEVPLFVELYGYGPFMGRRNQGTLEPLYARAFSFFDGEKRFLIFYSDTGSIPTDYAREFRSYFAEKYNLPFILLSDPERKAIEPYGVWQEKKMCGKTCMGVVRTTFIIDEQGLIEKVMPKVKPDTNAAEILEMLA